MSPTETFSFSVKEMNECCEMNKKCCICGKEFSEGHEAPEGVFICGRKCFKDWIQIIKLAREFQGFAFSVCDASKLDKSYKPQFDATFDWIVSYEQKEVSEYIS